MGRSAQMNPVRTQSSVRMLTFSTTAERSETTQIPSAMRSRRRNEPVTSTSRNAPDSIARR